MQHPGARDYPPYYPPYPSPSAAAAPSLPTYPSPSPSPSPSSSASAPPYSAQPTDFTAAAAAGYPTYPQPSDLLHYAPPPPPVAPPQHYFPYESHQPPPPANPVPSPYPSFDQRDDYVYGYRQELYPPKAAVGGWSDDGVYAYCGGDASEPYGARGSGPRSAAALFDDYGRSIGAAKERGRGGGGARPKVVRAVPKLDTAEDVRSGVQKFRVKLLPEGAGSPMDVLCQVGLDGIRMLDPNTSRTLRIYPLETVTRWDVLDSSIFAFWSKSSVDIEPRRIRLKSNSYTTNTILDTVTAASVQFKEMSGSSISRNKAVADAGKPSEQQNEKKKGFLDWRNLMKPVNEEKDHWVPDEAVSKCTACAADFSAFNRRHHCRNCGDIFCDKCTQGRTALTTDAEAQPVRVCDRCMAEVSQRLNNVREVANRPIVHSHEDLAKKLQEAMDINKRSSSALRSSDGSGRRMREVACPICTVHLQVQVPTSGSETIECGVCQHPFLLYSASRKREISGSGKHFMTMQLRERQDKVERALLLFKATKSGPFAEESTHVEGLINASGVLALTNDKKRDAAPDGYEGNTGISSWFMFQTTVRKKDALSAELVTDHKYIYQENDTVGSPLVLSKVMYLANINDYLSLAAVPVGARCDDFSTNPNLREGHGLASFNSLLRPPMLIKHHNHATGLIMRSKNFAVSIAGLISAVGKPVNTADASSIFTVFSQILCQMPDETRLTMSTAWHGPNPISRTNKAVPGVCIEMELEIDEDSRIGAWIEVQKSNSQLLTWAIALSDTPQDDLGWGVTLRRGTEGKLQRVQLDGFLNFHLGKKATLQPGVMFTVDARSCKPAVVFRSSWFL